MTTSLPAGLRERKKAKTLAAIREHGMRLFAEQGFAATAVDQIAEVVAERAGFPVDNLSARVLAGAVIGAMLAAVPHGMTVAYERSDFARMDEALELLMSGLPLRPDGPPPG